MKISRSSRSKRSPKGNRQMRRILNQAAISPRSTIERAEGSRRLSVRRYNYCPVQEREPQ
jgi:hypothetical protein